jgi:hypothetical protein
MVSEGQLGVTHRYFTESLKTDRGILTRILQHATELAELPISVVLDLCNPRAYWPSTELLSPARTLFEVN